MDKDLEITPLLERAYRGDREATEIIARAVHGDLLRLAKKVMYGRYGNRAQGLTLDPEALVNETFLKLLQQRSKYKNRSHLFAIATRIMFRVMADYHKARHRQKRAGSKFRVSLSALGQKDAVQPATEIPRLRDALDKLQRVDERAAQVAKLRLLWGLNSTETSEVLGVSRSTSDRAWNLARKWLADHL